MSKILTIIFITLSFFYFAHQTEAEDYFKVISRSDWGANEEYNYWDSVFARKIFAKWEANNSKALEKWNKLSQAEKAQKTLKSKEQSAKQKKMNQYLNNHFLNDVKIVDFQRYSSSNKKLAWAYQRTNSVKNIVIHHTASEYEDSFSGIKDIHKFHSINREWFDIGYHFVIGYNGEIFEGKSGGDYIVGAHDTWNNRSTIGIALMGDYNKKQLNNKQYTSLKKLVSHLTKKYGIDLNNKIPYHKPCYGDNCEHGLKTSYHFPIVGHRDGKSTSCPGEHIYNSVIPKLIADLQEETQGYKQISYSSTQKQKQIFVEKLKKLNWSTYTEKYSKLHTKKKILLQKRINFLLGQEIGWKKKLLLSELLKKIKNI